MSEYYFFYDTSCSVKRSFTRHWLGDEELGVAVKYRAAEALAVYLLEDSEVDEDDFKGLFATLAVADIRIRRMPLTSFLLGTNEA